MKYLSDYLINLLTEDVCNESNVFSFYSLSKIRPKNLKIGLLSMYDYILNNDDIKFFFQDMQASERPMWRALYDTYQEKLWSIVEINIDNNEDELLGIKKNILIKLTPQLKRGLRLLNSDLDVSKTEFAIIIEDELRKCSYLITINRSIDFSTRLSNMIDRNYLIRAFAKLGKA